MKNTPDVRYQQPAHDLGTGDDRGGESGNSVGVGAAIQLEQVRLHGVERVDADAVDERRRQHEPSYGWIAQPVFDRASEYLFYFGRQLLAAFRREANISHQKECRYERDR